MLNKIKQNIFWVALLALALYAIGRYFYAKPRFVNGETAPTFVAQRPDNTRFDLSSLRGKYVLLDFWGSWCGPCAAEAPDLRRLYDKHKGAAFDIVSVGIESDKDKWTHAIARLGLAWPNHVSDLQNMDSPLAKNYGVRVIPTKFLINPEGIIVGVNQSFEELDRYLSEKLR